MDYIIRALSIIVGDMVSRGEICFEVENE